MRPAACRRALLWARGARGLWPLTLALALAVAVVPLPAAAAPAAPPAPPAPPRHVPLDTIKYLTRFAYLPEMDLQKPFLRSQDQLTNAIKNLQRFAGVPVTGVQDAALEALLRRPRCGQPDLAGKPSRAKRHNHGADGVTRRQRRYRRYAIQGSKWPIAHGRGYEISWSLKTDVPGGLDKARVRQELQIALDLWARPSKLHFPESDNNAMIEVYFERGNHSDGYPFDGKGNILAHAFFPGSGRGGDVHFDEDEVWLMMNEVNGRGGREGKGTSLFAVAAHEFGHSLGLMHSSVAGSLMYPWYQDLQTDYQLPDDDRHAIQQLYGSREDRLWKHIPDYKPGGPSGTPRPGPPPRRPGVHGGHGGSIPTAPPPVAPPVSPYPRQPRVDPDKPDTCNTAYDAVAFIRGELFIFKGKYQWRIRDGGLLAGYPVETTLLWEGLPRGFTHVDAVYQRKDMKIVFFIGKEYYVYSGTQPDRGFPRPLTDLGLPANLSHIDAAMVWGYNGKTYLFAGNLYWRLDDDTGVVELDYPRDMSMWRGVGYNIDAVFQWKDGVTYFFKGKGFWRFNDLQMRVEHRMPKNSASFWMGCKEPEGRWFDWEENSVDIYNDIESSFYDHHLDYEEDEPSAAASVLSPFFVLYISVISSIYFTL